jgi:hypothetical protein
MCGISGLYFFDSNHPIEESILTDMQEGLHIAGRMTTVFIATAMLASRPIG